MIYPGKSFPTASRRCCTPAIAVRCEILCALHYLQEIAAEKGIVRTPERKSVTHLTPFLRRKQESDNGTFSLQLIDIKVFFRKQHDWRGFCMVRGWKEHTVMWLQRVLFNVKTRLLHPLDDGPPGDRLPWSDPPDSKRRRVQHIQNRLVDLDERAARLQAAD